jgi:hypothetical protein
MSKSAAALIFKNLLGMGFSWAAPDWCVNSRKISQLALLFTFCGALRHCMATQVQQYLPSLLF